MLTINKNDILVLSNGSGGRVAIEVKESFSSRILYQQIATNGGLDFSKKEGNIVKRSELDYYKVAQCETQKDANQAVQENSENRLKGYCNILSND